jgi:uncharacterized protein DUF5818
MKHMCIVAMFLFSTSLLFAQAREGYDQTLPATNQADTAGLASSTERITVEGCLTQDGYRGFVLTDTSGLVYYMNGDRKKLTHRVGQEVRIAGIASPSRNPSTPGAIAAAASPEGVAPHLTIISIHRVADSCRSTGSR